MAKYKIDSEDVIDESGEEEGTLEIIDDDHEDFSDEDLDDGAASGEEDEKKVERKTRRKFTFTEDDIEQDRKRDEVEKLKKELTELRAANRTSQSVNINNKKSQLMLLGKQEESLQASLASALENGEHAQAAKLQTDISELLLRKMVVQAEVDNYVEPADTTEEEDTADTASSAEDVPQAAKDWMGYNKWVVDPISDDEERAQKFVERTVRKLKRRGDLDMRKKDFYEDLQDQVEEYIQKNNLEVEGYEDLVSKQDEDDKPEKKKQTANAGSSRASKTRNKRQYKVSKEDKAMARRMNLPIETFVTSKLRTEQALKDGGARRYSIFEN